MERYYIVNKIIIEDGSVFLSAAPSHVRPLTFQRTEDDDLTGAYRAGGLQVMLSVALRRVYRGQWRLRGQSRLTRALRESIHAFPLELIGRLDEDTVVYALSLAAEKILSDPDYDPAGELSDLLRLAHREQTEDNALRVRLFGRIELKNDRGRVVENPSRQSLPWMLLKYLLADPGRAVTLPELLEWGVWPAGETGDEIGAARVRLRRLREALAPLGLDGKRGLVTFTAGRYALNPDCPVRTDAEDFAALMEKLSETPVEDPAGLALCREALELFRGPYMEHTEDEPWLTPARDFYGQQFATLIRAALARCEALGDCGILPLLCRRGAAIAPGNEALQQEIIRFLMEHRREAELMQHMTGLIRGGKAPWIDGEARPAAAAEDAAPV